ncbi:glutathione S-transferase family protein [Rhodoplanes roseus]|uniref:GST N-terminal domain-containing protein n=1 Tax=Rhodoplanes roseus TaxID=29409 RepID=A0A327L1L6_9BRAD|nr:glutathione S-transferase family protein [Rhodoplanes roseus]RAI43865.1 hypothetical protein CH341_12105 [Rhodoplanes roseus]
MLTIHHLYRSRSERLLFLVHTLDIDHRVVAYHRHPETMLAPAELTAVHPLGSAPVLVDGAAVIAESGAAVIYLAETYGGGRLVPRTGSTERERCFEWIHFNEGTLMTWLNTLMLLTWAGAEESDQFAFVTRRVAKLASYLDLILREQVFLCGAELTIADVMTAFTLDFMSNRTFPDLALFRIPGLDELVALRAYADRLRRQPGYVYSQRQGF